MNRIKDLRCSNNMSQTALGKVLGCAGPTVSKYELEQRQLDPATINAICDFFGVTADYLLCRSDSPQPVMTDAEAEMLAAYRAASDDAKAVVDLTLKPWRKSQQKRVS